MSAINTRCPICRLDVGPELAARGLCPVCAPERVRIEAPELFARIVDDADAPELLDDEEEP
ncbi:MAG: hypothetical protein JWM53_960 [bacterium]|nr:hypothetical protein [bacterium]